MLASFLLALFCSLIVGVQASGRGFQPVLQPPVKRSIRADANSNSTQKRWISTQPGKYAYEHRLWPKGLVTYALEMEGDADEPQLTKLINDAKFSWYQAGLPLFQFGWKKVSKADCEADRANCCMVKTKGISGYRSTISMPPVVGGNGYEGPYMELEWPFFTVQNPIYYTPLQVVAHEMGHVWGLHHEQQNPAYWASKYSGGTATIWDGKVFGDNNWDCKALSDFAQTYAQASADTASTGLPTDPMVFCYDIRWAKHYRFSGQNYLPEWQDITGDKLSEASIPESEVDYDSIMMYSSTASGKRVYWKPDGSDIPIISKTAGPSPRDVIALKTLYGNSYPAIGPPLLNKPSSPSNAQFKKLTC